MSASPRRSRRATASNSNSPNRNIPCLDYTPFSPRDDPDSARAHPQYEPSADRADVDFFLGDAFMDRKGFAFAMVVSGLLGACDDDNGGVGTAAPPPPPAPPPAAPPAAGASNAVILEWNQLLTDNQGAGSLFSFRQYAMLHVAMFDAVNSVNKQYRPYRLEVSPGASASEEAAAAQAGRDILVALYPAAAASFDTALATRLAALPQVAASQGVTIGSQVAANVLQWRAMDGSAGPDPAYVPPPIAGLWRSATPGQVASGGRMLTMMPFALLTSTQYLPLPPPPLDSAEYADNYNQVRDLGRADSVVRTPDQTLFSRMVAGVNYRPGPFALWNSIARNLATSRQLSLSDTARLFALLNVSMHDGLQTSHASKYVYNLWRPVTAIANAADDANNATVADATWTPLLPTPPYPSHASNVACIGTSAARALARALASDQVAFNVTWTWTGAAGAGTDVTRPFAAFSQLADEAGMSRVHGGIHFEFELHAAAAACTKVADYIHDNFMRPRGAP
jgi:hypothetical protein